jgi:Family of unknown function (DUF5675)
MIFKLTRTEYNADGILGILKTNDEFVSVTLEHAYDSGLGNGTFIPKVAAGTYTCLRHPPNRLLYETFELQNVPNFEGSSVTGILIHIGNFNKDSEGCILLGTSSASDGTSDITGSKVNFEKFMGLLTGINNFTLVIT